MTTNDGWKLIVTPRESVRVQKHAFHFGYKWATNPDYELCWIDIPYIFFHLNKKIYCVELITKFDNYTNYTTITVKDFLKLTL